MKRSKLEKQKEAESRANARAKRSHKDQLAVLDSRLGSGLGSTKERARLKDLIENVKEVKVEKKRKGKKEDIKKDELTV